MALKRRLIKTVLILTAVLFSLCAALMCLTAVFAWREMVHEGLTYSQWYESAIRGYYLAWLYAALSILAALTAWYAALRVLLGKPLLRRDHPKSAVLCRIAFGVMTFLVCLLGFHAIQSWQELLRAANAECASAALAGFGRARNAFVLSVVFWLGLLTHAVLRRVRRPSALPSGTPAKRDHSDQQA